MTLAEGVTIDTTTVEDGALLLDAAAAREDESCCRETDGGGRSASAGDRVRRRLAVCLFLHIVGVAVVTQVYPRVILDHFDDNDARASRFNGWLTLISSFMQLISIPTLCGASDVVGRRMILGGCLALSSLSHLSLGLAPSSIVAVSACQLVSGVAGAILPISQAIIIDLSHWGKSSGGGEVTHGLGLIGAAFGLAISVGPVLGGSLSEKHRSTACILAASMSLVALLSMTFYYGWEETSPAVHAEETAAAAATTTVNSGGGARSLPSTGSAWRIVNPFLVLRVFLSSSSLMQMAAVLSCFSLSLNVFCVYYNYLDFRYHWDALDISLFFSTFGVLLALTSGFIIRFLVPNRLSMEKGVLLGLLLQAISSTLYGLAPRGWMLYPVLLATVLQYITEPCIQGLMATLVGADRQGSLQGAVQCLRIVAAGFSGVVYGQIFSLGVSDALKKSLGFLVPGLALFCSAGCSLLGLAVAWVALRQVGGGIALAPKAADASLDAREEGTATQLTEGICSRGDGNGDLSDRKSAPVDTTGLNLAVLAVADPTRDEEETGPGASERLLPRGLPMTGLGDEEDAVSDVSEPLLPRGGGGGGGKGDRSYSS